MQVPQCAMQASATLSLDSLVNTLLQDANLTPELKGWMLKKNAILVNKLAVALQNTVNDCSLFEGQGICRETKVRQGCRVKTANVASACLTVPPPLPGIAISKADSAAAAATRCRALWITEVTCSCLRIQFR